VRCEQKLVGVLNAGRFSRDAEVVVAPPSLYLNTVKSSLRGDVGIAAQVRKRANAAKNAVAARLCFGQFFTRFPWCPGRCLPCR
jgi:hypothetical protein